MNSFSDIWVYLSQTPLLWLTLTVSVFYVAQTIYTYFNNNPLLNPVLISIFILVPMLSLTNTPYNTYFTGAQFVHFLLGTATVGLAIPLYLYYDKLKQLWLPLLLTLLIGSATGILSAIIIGKLLGVSQITLLSLMPKSITTPIAMGISEKIGGLPSLTAILVILTGMIGAIFAPFLFKLIKIKDHSIQGVAMGISAHGLGTAKAFQMSQETGAFSGLAMGLNGAMTALLIPLFLYL
jgi:predicted murein hydrolase (TIGR00659 family)